MTTVVRESGSTPPIAAVWAQSTRSEAGNRLVRRPRLMELIRSARGARVVVLTAPAGYSKTTSLGEWWVEDDRPFAWVTARSADDDPAVLVASIVEALDRIEPVDPEVLAPLASPKPSISTVVLPRLRRALARSGSPFVLVIDDLHTVGSAEAFEVISAVVESLPAGCHVALASRTEPPLPLGRMRAKRELVELTATDLTMTREESAELLRNLGLGLKPKELDVIFEKAEGWPATLYLAGLALMGQSDLGAAVESFEGDERFVVDYLRDEFLSATSDAVLGFLTRTSVLDELSGPLCDAVLERSGSAPVLEDLARSNSLVIPLDRRGERYRYHHLFAEMLQSELRRNDPEAEPELHARASRWYADHADSDRAIEHAIAAGDIERAGELIWLAFPEASGRGRIATIRRWLDDLGEESIAAYPKLALSAAHTAIASGEGGRAAHWIRIAAASASEPSMQGGATVEADVLLLRATVGMDGVVQMGKDAARASELHPPEAPWQTPCYLFRGVSSHLTGHPERALPMLQESARRGAVVSPVVQSLALSQLSLIAMDDDDWEGGLRLIAQAHEQVRRCGLVEYPSLAMVYATSALARVHDGQVEAARADVVDATRLLSAVVELPRWYEAQVRIVLARACIRLDDLAGGRALLDEAKTFLELTPEASILGQWMKQSKASLKTAVADGRGADWALTTAELRTLQYLPSHLSFREIGERIHVSPNTVKTQARAVYRKLDASSRAGAVERAREAGLLDEDPFRGEDDH